MTTAAVENPERAKYQRMWNVPDYRAIAPGEHRALRFLAQARVEKDAEIIDFGCGTGRGGLQLALFGAMKVTLLDFTDNCLDPEVAQACVTQPTRIKFVQADLTKPMNVSAAYGYCFPAGTYVAGSGGKTIEVLKADDIVSSSTGQPQKILKTFRHIYRGRMVELKVSGLPDITMTAEHPVQIYKVSRVHRSCERGKRGNVWDLVVSAPQWVPAGDVRAGDWLAVPRVAANKVATMHFSANSQGRVDGGSGIATAHRVDADVAWLLGLYVAEGSCARANNSASRNAIVLSLGTGEESLARRAILAFGKLGVSARISQPPSAKRGGALHVLACSIGLAAILEEWCGIGAANKHIPLTIMSARDEVARSFVEGYVAGDGCLVNGMMRATTVSKSLALDLLVLLQRLGVSAAVYQTVQAMQSVICGREVSCSSAYAIHWSARAWASLRDASGRVPFGRTRFSSGNALMRVTGTDYYQVSDLPVFNIHTEDETYGVPFTVHNCTDVMEHIPPEDVDKVLDNILSSAHHCFFAISTVDDVMGAEIGEPLHLTVKPTAWWAEKLRDHGAVIHWSCDDFEDCCAFYCTSWKDAGDLLAGGVVNTKESDLDAQVAENIKAGWTNINPYNRQDREVVLLAGGPTMNEKAQVDEIRRLREKENACLVTVNGAYKWAIDQGLSISAQIVLDARAFNARFTRPILDKCMYLIASQVHPSTLEGLPKDRTYLWHSGISEANAKLAHEVAGNYFPIPGGSTVVLRALPLLRLMGYWRIHLFGADSCVMNGAHHAYEQVENNGEPTVPVTCGGRTFQCVPWMLSQASEFRDLVKFLGDEVELALYGHGLLHHMIQTGASFSTKE